MAENSQQHSPAPGFDVAVPASGYRWWYIDGISADGRHGIVVIAFVGSVFSPYYFRARSRGPADPQDYCALNVGLYRPGRKRWCMTERGLRALDRGVDWFALGPSRLEWRSGRLEISIDERSAPSALPLAGRVVIDPEMRNDRAFSLDAGGRHSWQPLAPAARIDVTMQRPSLAWSGHGYIDTNAGQGPLEDDFDAWHWSRGRGRSATAITYSVDTRDGDTRSLALQFSHAGGLQQLEPPPLQQLPVTGWRIPRPALASRLPLGVRTLEDTPFYARSLLTMAAEDNAGTPHYIMHESLSVKRFRRAWVRTLLPFRMPRRAWAAR